jgi:hypothetical protein
MCFIYFGVEKGNGEEKREKKEERRKKEKRGRGKEEGGCNRQPSQPEGLTLLAPRFSSGPQGLAREDRSRYNGAR